MTGLRTLVRRLVDLSWAAEQRAGPSAAQEVLAYARDATAAELEYRRRRRDLAARLSALGETEHTAARVPAPEAGGEPETALVADGGRLDSLERRLAQLSEHLRDAVQGIGVVHYTAFPDTGGSLSFSIALLDGRANGVVVSVLTGRETLRVYGKRVEEGQSGQRLSEEERRALDLARRTAR